MSPPLLRLTGLRVGFRGAADDVLKHIDLDLAAGQVCGLIGASGAGKSLLARALIGLLPQAAELRGGRVQWRGQSLEASQIGPLRGGEIAYVFQDAAASLHPLRRIRAQLREALAVHAPGLDSAAADARIASALRDVGMDADRRWLQAYPHQLSGGQRQRLMLALTLLPEPALLVADEPTSALDPVLAKRVCELLVAATRARGMALLLISHDLPRVAEYCERVYLLQDGRLQAADHGLLGAHGAVALIDGGLQGMADGSPDRYAHSYVDQGAGGRGQGPKLAARSDHAAGRVPCPVPPAPSSSAVKSATYDVFGESSLAAHELSLNYDPGRRWPWSPAAPAVVNSVTLSLAPGERLAVVGSSGSGKSTLARGLLGLMPAASGQVGWFGRSFTELDSQTLRRWRRRVQMVFQDPYRTLDPLQRVDRMLIEALRFAPTPPVADQQLDRARALLQEVGLEPEALWRYPSQFSGGQRQRLAIARALACEPDVLICDEATSALDHAVQTQILNLLDHLAEQRGLALLFISHDLAAVARLCQRLLVMDQGRAVEAGPVASLLAHPQSAALRALLEARPASVSRASPS
jgi:peptide/nickel transport system ATP-binding protein